MQYFLIYGFYQVFICENSIMVVTKAGGSNYMHMKIVDKLIWPSFSLSGRACDQPLLSGL